MQPAEWNLQLQDSYLLQLSHCRRVGSVNSAYAACTRGQALFHIRQSDPCRYHSHKKRRKPKPWYRYKAAKRMATLHTASQTISLADKSLCHWHAPTTQWTTLPPTLPAPASAAVAPCQSAAHYHPLAAAAQPMRPVAATAGAPALP
jgi:hypothetical protein